MSVTAPDRLPVDPGPSGGGRPSPRWRPPIALVLGVGATAAFAALRPGPFRAAVTEPAALLRIGLVVAALVVWSLLLRRIVRAAPLRGVLLALPVALVLWVAIVPYFRSTRVDEALPGLDEVAADAPAPTPVPVTEPPAGDADPTAAPAPTTTAAPVPTEPVLVGSAPLAGIDHRASGTAALYALPDGSLVVRLEEIDIESGPDYDLYVVGAPDRSGPDGGLRLDDLRANQGSHNYPVAADGGVDLGAPFTVLVWCEAFAVPVANATITPTA